MANANPSPDTRFKAGQSGNPGGRPKGISIATMIAESLTEKDAQRIVRAAINAAKKGDVRYFQQLIERTDGKVMERLEASGDLTLSLALVDALRSRARIEPE